MKVFLLVVLGLLLLVGAFLYFGQAKLIYFPRRYDANDPKLERVETLSYRLEGREQTLLLVEPRDGVKPERVWWLYGGNASTASDWIDLVAGADPTKPTLFVLFDYPGYGHNEGKPSPETISASMAVALSRVAREFELSREELARRSSALGHSLGAAVALDAARRYGFSEVVALSPFTTMREMAKRQVGPLLAPMLRHRYDNETALSEWMQSPTARRFVVFHGRRDRIVPFSMGEELAARADESEFTVEFFPVPEAGHNDMLGYVVLAVVRILEGREL